MTDNDRSFRATPSLTAVFESRHLPRAFLFLLEGLLSVNPLIRPTCERIMSAMREGRVCIREPGVLSEPGSSTFQFNPVTLRSRASLGSLIPVRRPVEEGRRELSPSNPRALPPLPPPVPEPQQPEVASQGDETNSSVPPSEGDEKSPLLRLPSPPLPSSEKRNSFERLIADIGRVLGIRVTQEALVRSAKSCILAAKVASRRFRCSRRSTYQISMHAGGLSCVSLGRRSAPTSFVGNVDGGGHDGYDLGAGAGFASAGGVSCADDVDRRTWSIRVN